MGNAWPKSFQVWYAGDGDWGPLGCRFNSALSNKNVTPGQNATLTLYLRLMLVERNARDLHEVRKVVPPPRPGFLRDWAPGEFIAYKNAVKSKAEGFWNNQFTLRNVLDVSTLDVRVGDKVVRPNISCKLEIVLVDSVGDAHQVINCFCPTTPEDLPCYVSPHNDGTGTGQFRDNLVQMAQRTIKDGKACFKDAGDPLKPELMTRVPARCDARIDQLGVAHEIGHLLGLPHVGVARRTHDCLEAMSKGPEGINAKVCYTGDRMYDAMNIMGMGNGIDAWNAMPWITRLFQHTGIGPHAWKVALDDVPPKVL